MQFGLEKFKANISKQGLASPNKFEVEIFIPLTTGNTISSPLAAAAVHRHEALDIMCDTITIAGKTIASAPDLQYGVRREVAYAAPTYDALTLTFYCSEELEEKKILDRWQDKIVKTNGADGSFDMGYYDDYAKYSKIIVTKFSVSGIKTFSCEYREVFPKTVTAIDLSHGISSGPMKVSATFAYTNWKDTTSS